MRHVQTLGEKDPLRLKKLKPANLKFLYLWLLLAVMLLVLALVFRFLSRMSKRVDTVEQYESRIEAWNEADVKSQFADLAVAVQIVPGASPHKDKNMLLMDLRETPSDEEREDRESAGDRYPRSYFFANDTEGVFPVLNFKPEYLPVGDARGLCIHMLWTSVSKKIIYDQYKSVVSQAKCPFAEKPGSRWQDSDPRTGEDLFPWRQREVDFECGSEEECQAKCNEHKGYFKNNSERCFTYQVLDQVCMLVRENHDDEAGQGVRWEFAGGCFKNRTESIRMKQAEPGKSYSFEHIKIEVRHELDPYVVAAENDFDLGFNLGIFRFLMWVCFLASIGFLIAFIVGLVVAFNRIRKSEGGHRQFNESNV